MSRQRVKNKFNAAVRRQQNHKDVNRVKVFRSNKHMTVMFIDNEGVCRYSMKTTDEKILKKTKVGSNIKAATEIGLAMGAWLKKEKLDQTKVIFDRNGFIYHGRIKAVAEGIRESGVNF